MHVGGTASLIRGIGDKVKKHVILLDGACANLFHYSIGIVSTVTGSDDSLLGQFSFSYFYLNICTNFY